MCANSAIIRAGIFIMNDFGFLRVAAVCPPLFLGDVEKNVKTICDTLDVLKKSKVQVAVFPELCITGYTCGDLFSQSLLLETAEKAIEKILPYTKGIAVFVGLPLRGTNGALYNAAALLNDAETVLIYPKRFIPNYGEFYEKRWFTPYDGEDSLFKWPIGGCVKLYSGGIFTGAVVGCEICEDAWVPLSPSTAFALEGANVIVNLSAGNEVIGKKEYRRDLVKMNSAKNICAYIYANAGTDESSQDLVFSGHSIIAENGTVLKEKHPFSESCFIISDIDIEKLNHERMRTETFSQKNVIGGRNFGLKETRAAFVEPLDLSDFGLYRNVDGHPFVPGNEDFLFNHCIEISRIQRTGLARRIKAVGVEKVVIGISGGLDSTLALLVACNAFDYLKLDRKGIIGITMPGFGTTDRTYENAKSLVKNCGATLVEIPIKEAATVHLKDLSHPLDLYDVTYENAQARERTQVLFDYANMHNAILIGTGDLSELALGWCTYNGDQMSNYGVNNSIPKTLVRFLVKFYAGGEGVSRELKDVLNDILETPVSPELLPPDKDGNIAQKTESSIGSYILHDFFLYNCVRNGFSPKKIYFLAKASIKQNMLEEFSDSTIKNTLKTFYKRFFSQQFKRSCMPDGVKVGTVSLSPRGDWRMPSDALADLWLKQVEEL